MNSNSKSYIENSNTSIDNTINDFSYENLFELIEQARHKVIIKLHPNGFLQIPLTNIEDKRKSTLQLHLRDQSIERRGHKQFEVHDHAFTIESYVLQGELQDITYEVKPNIKWEFKVFSSDGTGQMVASEEKCDLEETNRRVIKEGEKYTIDKWDFHSSNPLIFPTATCIIKSSIDQNYNPKLVAPIAYKQDKIEVSRNIDQNSAWNIVDNFLNTIKVWVNSTTSTTKNSLVETLNK